MCSSRQFQRKCRRPLIVTDRRIYEGTTVNVPSTDGQKVLHIELPVEMNRQPNFRIDQVRIQDMLEPGLIKKETERILSENLQRRHVHIRSVP